MPSEMQTLIANLSRMQIDDFFRENADVTRAECDQWATQAVGRPVCASPVQGVTSYTVVPVDRVDGDTGIVIQFRSAEYAFDLEFLQYVQVAYGSRFVPRHRDSGTLGGLHAYMMDDVGGVAVYLARDQLRAHGGCLLSNTLEDFAKFFAAAWHNTPSPMATPDRDEKYTSYKADLVQLHQGLPERFHKMLDRLLQALPTLFVDDWPMVPNHTDLLENNIHVDPKTGHITGICDWKDATVSPFGTSLEGLESLLGERTTTGWRWICNSAELRRGFWSAFAAAMGSSALCEIARIDAARLVGIFLKYGLVWVDAENREPVAEGSSGLGYLEAVTLELQGNG
ncbi:hypothetical protein CC80DRAFT_493979 [Byssothecium circinans]|uniref:Aminoglycoside phosphotransferase domain-containing protein n=1 Tax=Byssothecium circinans TaxID=147558 RepID=A0A6A5TPI5_9PLEO|nr:hypothetical protein CC80DRAFT_493979 [Byssothecium circinans]